MPSWPPWLRLAWHHPEQLSEHVAAYAALATDEAGAALAMALHQARLQLILGASLVVAATLAGVSLLLWAALPGIGAGAAWALVAVPLVPLLPAAWARRAAGRGTATPAFAGLRGQLALDREAWRVARARPAAGGHAP